LTLSVADNNAPGSLITTVTSTDSDNEDVLTLTLSGTDAAYFDFVDNGDKTGKALADTQ